MTLSEAREKAIRLVTSNGRPPTKGLDVYLPIPPGMIVHAGIPSHLCTGVYYHCPLIGRFIIAEIFHLQQGVQRADDISMVTEDDLGQLHVCLGSAAYLESWTRWEDRHPGWTEPPKKKQETDKEREMRFFNTSAHDKASPWWQHWEADGDDWIG
jgi:hypothetical protein